MSPTLICVHCQARTKDLVVSFTQDAMSLRKCQVCGKECDPYLEHSVLLLALSLFIYRATAARHVLSNHSARTDWLGSHTKRLWLRGFVVVVACKGQLWSVHATGKGLVSWVESKSPDYTYLIAPSVVSIASEVTFLWLLHGCLVLWHLVKKHDCCNFHTIRDALFQREMFSTTMLAWMLSHLWDPLLALSMIFVQFEGNHALLKLYPICSSILCACWLALALKGIGVTTTSRVLISLSVTGASHLISQALLSY
eukprot:m.251968 g.251968  ORF g.251968 m.251968 type:complete len:254 (+) comp15465_c1_seq2:277-1038(+)